MASIFIHQQQPAIDPLQHQEKPRLPREPWLFVPSRTGSEQDTVGIPWEYAAQQRLQGDCPIDQEQDKAAHSSAADLESPSISNAESLDATSSPPCFSSFEDTWSSLSSCNHSGSGIGELTPFSTCCMSSPHPTCTCTSPRPQHNSVEVPAGPAFSLSSPSLSSSTASFTSSSPSSSPSSPSLRPPLPFSPSRCDSNSSQSPSAPPRPLQTLVPPYTHQLSGPSPLFCSAPCSPISVSPQPPPLTPPTPHIFPGAPLPSSLPLLPPLGPICRPSCRAKASSVESPCAVHTEPAALIGILTVLPFSPDSTPYLYTPAASDNKPSASRSRPSSSSFSTTSKAPIAQHHRSNSTESTSNISSPLSHSRPLSSYSTHSESHSVVPYPDIATAKDSLNFALCHSGGLDSLKTAQPSAQHLATALPSSDPSDQGSIFSTTLSTPKPHLTVTSTLAPVSRSTLVPVPVETTVTITTTEINLGEPCSEKTYYYHRHIQLPQQQQLQRQSNPNTPPYISATEIQPLVLVSSEHNHDNDLASQDPQALVQVQSSLDYLEYLENCLLSDQEAEALTNLGTKRRPQSWIALKKFVSHHLQHLNKSQGNENLLRYKESLSQASLGLSHPNHSAPLIDRSLLSPSLPVLRSAPICLPSGDKPPRIRAQTIRDNNERTSVHRRETTSTHRGTSVDDRNTCPLPSIRATVPGPALALSSFALSPSSSSSSSSSSQQRSPGNKTRPHSLHSGHSTSSPSSSSFLRSTFTAPLSNNAVTSFSRLQSHLKSSASTTSTISTASTDTTNNNIRLMTSHTRTSTSLSNHTSSSLSPLATNSAASCTFPTSSSTRPVNMPSYGTPVPRSSSRKMASGQHPLATVSTFEPDRESSMPTNAYDGAQADYTHLLPQDTERDLESLMATISSMAANAPSLDTREPTIITELRPKDAIATAGLPRPLDSKQRDLSVLKSAIRSGSSQLYMLQIKSETGGGDGDNINMNIPSTHQAQSLHGSQPTTEQEWTGVVVASGGDHPISPLTVTRPVMPLVFPQSAPNETNVDDEAVVARPESPSSSSPLPPPEAPAVPPRSPRREFEKWTPPPPGQRRAQQDAQRRQSILPQPHTRLPIPRLLKQRSFNFPFSSSGSSSSQSGGSSNVPAGRVSADGSSRASEQGDSDHTPRSAASCDIPRPIGPPDPIPAHYQHLQNRQNRRSTSFRRRSHGGELERFSAGWIVTEGGAGSGQQHTPRMSVSDDQSPDSRRPLVPRRHGSLGVQPNSSSMWGRLFTSIFSSTSGSESGGDQDNNSSRGSDGGIVDLYLQQQRLLLAPSTQQQQQQQQQQSSHPLYQQQLFFYADEVIDGLARADSDHTVSQDEDYGDQRRSSSEGSSDPDDAPSFFPGSLALNTNLQGELAQEDRRESIEFMMHPANDTVFVRPDTPSQLIGDGFVVPKSLSAEGKIPVSCLALSSPPSYWEAEIKYQGWPRIDPRPEQGQESLPRYTCSVFREGCVNRKTELVGNWRPYRRPWKRTFAHLRGTALRLYAVDAEDVPRIHVRNISLQLARCELATDYKQRPNVIRIRACDRTVLVECKDRIDALTWLEHLQAAANIATSLEDRSMPKFYTLPRAQQSRQNSGAGSSSSAQRSNASSTVSNRNQRSQGSREQQQQQQQQQQDQLEQQLQQQRRIQQQQYVQEQQRHCQFQQHQQQQQQEERERLYRQQQQQQQEFYIQRQQEEEQEREQQQRQQRQRQSSESEQQRSPRSSQRERQMSFERTPRPSQRQRQPSVDLPPHSAGSAAVAASPSGAPHPNPFQQLQQVLQSQQEQILAIQCRVQREQRARQLVVQSNEDSSVLSPSLGRAEPDMLAPASPRSSSSSTSSSSSSRRRAFGRSRQNSSQSPTHSPPRSPSYAQAHAPSQSPPYSQSHQSPAQSRRTQTSLMTRSERERTMTEGDRRRENATRQNEDAVMRSVLHALGQNSSDDDDSNSSIIDSGEEGGDEHGLRQQRQQQQGGRRYRMSTSAASFHGQQPPPPVSRRDTSQVGGGAQHAQYRPNQEAGARASRYVEQRDNTTGGQEWERTRFACAQQQQQLQLLQQYHEQQQAEAAQEQQRQRRQRASWNRRLFGNLWRQHDHGHGHGQLVVGQQPLTVATST